ncbi:MAG: glycoside hydrolase domain-containing protein [bacterium]|nr:hypothetical protein [Candidatus Sumerlaeota bacterium]
MCNQWCLILDRYNFADATARQQKGDEVWWYICCGPRTPYVGEFIDHPAIDLRMWPWQTWKYKVQGILIWETAWWHSPARDKNEGLQNPWDDPMSYTDSDEPNWGNGDGRFITRQNAIPIIKTILPL